MFMPPVTVLPRDQLLKMVYSDAEGFYQARAHKHWSFGMNPYIVIEHTCGIAHGACKLRRFTYYFDSGTVVDGEDENDANRVVLDMDLQPYNEHNVCV